jgi:hypothetical protein
VSGLTPNVPEAYNPRMCIFCGGIDPAHDQLIVQAAIAGGATPLWMLRRKVRDAVDRVRGKAPEIVPDPTSCQLADENSERATNRG